MAERTSANAAGPFNFKHVQTEELREIAWRHYIPRILSILGAGRRAGASEPEKAYARELQDELARSCPEAKGWMEKLAGDEEEVYDHILDEEAAGCLINTAKKREWPEPQEDLVGLALSGGGIRSATFNLGVLQALAKLKLLRSIDYLSTVSGGGYIGSWLVAWIKREGFARVVQWLRPDWKEHPDTSQDNQKHAAPQIEFLRDYSNYLTPRLGFFSADTWTMVTSWLRNTLLCQTVLLPALVGALLLPRLFGWIAQCCGQISTTSGADKVQFLLAFGPALLLLLVPIWVIGRNLKLIVSSFLPEAPIPEYSSLECPRWIITLGVGFTVLAAWWVSCALWTNRNYWRDERLVWFAIWGALGYLVIWGIGFWISGVWRVAELVVRGVGKAPKFWSAAIGSTLLSGAVGGLLIKVLLDIFRSWNSLDGGTWHNLTFGTPLVALTFMAAIVVHVGLMGRYLPDPLREWLSKAGAWLFIFIMGWVTLCAISFYGPLGIVWLAGYTKTRVGVLLAWLLSTVGGIVAGKSPSTGKEDGKPWLELLAKLSPFVFLTGLLLLLSFGINEALPKLIGNAHISPSGFGQLAEKGWFDAYRMLHWFALSQTSSGWLVVAVVVCGLLALFLSWRVDLNEFSMHMFYRNRLVRCYLGAAHESATPKRNPHPFTGFDPKDDILMAKLVHDGPLEEGEKHYAGPYPILNTTLEVTHGERLAWQERKAGCFTITPLFCGFKVNRPTTGPCGKQSQAQPHGYRPTRDYAYPGKLGGLYLGTAMGISGAAASPNMGYHTSAPLAFLMTVFNVRLGYWLGNPRRNTWTEAGPRLGLGYLFKELFASTDDKSGYVYLSDGGHFENLGIYELVRRGCRLILASDASEDANYQLEGLGDAIRKCREDFGVDIEIDAHNLYPAGKAKMSKSHFAVGRIRYDKVSEIEKPGILIYVKASLTGDEPVDVLEYRSKHEAFPHDTTADQWFSESQFESYRKLGQHVVEQLLKKDSKLNQAMPVRSLFEMDAWRSKDATELETFLNRELSGVYRPQESTTGAERT